MKHDDAEKYGYSAFDDELQMQNKREAWKDIEIARLTAEGARIRAVVDEQVDDEGLWFVAETAPEAYLQAALRRLHEVIEGKTGDEIAKEIVSTRQKPSELGDALEDAIDKVLEEDD